MKHQYDEDSSLYQKAGQEDDEQVSRKEQAQKRQQAHSFDRTVANVYRLTDRTVFSDYLCFDTCSGAADKSMRAV